MLGKVEEIVRKIDLYRLKRLPQCATVKAVKFLKCKI